MESNLIEISKNLINNYEKIDDLVDKYLEPIKDYTDTASDIFASIKAIHSLYTLNKKRKFKSFLKAYAKSLNENEFNNFHDIEKLKTYLKDEKNFNFLSDTIENAINSRSVYGSILLGYYAGQILSENKRISYKDLIIIDGIKELNDIELSCFTRIYNKADLSKMVYFHQLDLDVLEFFSKLTIEKLIQLRFIEKDHTVYHGGNKNYNFSSTEIAEDVFFLIKEVGINDELINYQF